MLTRRASVTSYSILMVSFEAGRSGPARLPKELAAAGFRVHALCLAGDALGATRFVERVFILHSVKSLRCVERQLGEVMTASQPDLIVPCDERAVACLQTIVRRAGAACVSRHLSADQLATLVVSLGDPDHFDALLMKRQTLALARRLGVPTPDTATVGSAAGAKTVANDFGWPVYLKQPFGWAGRGVVRCDSPSEIDIALTTLIQPNASRARRLVRRVLSRNWYPSGPDIDIQKAVDGVPAMVCAVAWRGRMLAAFSGFARKTLPDNGPSTVVAIARHEEMETVAERMIGACGASGFLGFDFMIDRRSGRALLLECNPRPIQICHLGARIGVDLAEALAEALAGRHAALRQAAAGTEVVVALFPNGRRHADDIAPLDRPVDDEGLVAALLKTSLN